LTPSKTSNIKQRRTYLDEEEDEIPFLNSHLPIISGWDALELNQGSIDDRYQNEDQLQESRRQDTLDDGLGDHGKVV
jgi:hypothetical protein